MPRKLFRRIIFLLLIGGIGWWLWSNKPEFLGQSPPPPIPVDQANVDIPEFLTTILQVSGDAKHFAQCQTECQPLPQQQSDAVDAVTDGISWYNYQNETIQRTWNQAGKSELIVSNTDLVTPRDLIISPDGQKVAYWLDNITNTKTSLTELWMYDATAGGTQLLAEKLVKPDVTTKARWNRANSHLWFIGSDELLIVTLQPPSIAARFNHLQLADISDIIDQGAVDLSQTGRSLAYATPTKRGRSNLVIIHDGSPPQFSTIAGRITYLQWLEDGSLLYLVQSPSRYTFWRTHSTVHEQLLRAPGQFLSGHSDSTGQYLIYAATHGDPAPQLNIFDIGRGIIERQGTLPVFGQTHRAGGIDTD